ncbi:helix-turn-helix domain-containing protein [Caenispirillum bisanense]|uniref:helix-turn-helix domain-containing protein n=1 Tax=Caenispirillum bisanense TaxID=414052 RepID=UPI0031D6A7B6
MQVRAVDRVASGSAARLLLVRETEAPRTVVAAEALVARHLPLRQAHRAMTLLLERGRAVVELPMVEDRAALAADLAACGIRAVPYQAPAQVDVKAIRERSGLSQEDFALRFGLDVATVRNWEQGRSQPDTASRILLAVIDHDPAAVQAVLAA